MSNIKLFETKQIRSVWNESDRKWYFSVADVVETLTDSANARDYIKKMRKRESELNANWGTMCPPLELLAPDGKRRKTQCANTEGLLRIIQSILSPKAEPFKRWLAMDQSEKVAYEHILFRGHQDAVYEPDGNIPPDFLVDEHIAVEVRRLNQNDFSVMPHRGLEESEIPLRMHLVRLLASYGTSTVTRFIGLDFRRPLPKWSVIEKGARTFLDNVAADALPKGTMRMVAPNVELEYLCAVANAGDAFNLGAVSDDDWGGWLLEQLDKNLRLCVDEKARKIAPYRSRYPEWWLILIDQVAYGLRDHERQQLCQNTRIKHDWDKIIIVSPIDHSHYFEM